LIDIQRGRVTLPRYPFPARKTRVIQRDDITEVIDWFPPAIVTTNRELLLASRAELENLQAFCREHDIPFTQRYDVWGDLLDPFLDSEFSSEDQAANRKRLRDRGLLTDLEIDDIRGQVERKMLRLTGLTWEWQHYGLSDVLTVMKPRTWIGRKKWAAFYAEAIEVSLRGERINQ